MLVKGYVVDLIETNQEMLFALTEDERAFKSAPHIPDTCFDGPNRQWTKTNRIPSEAEFIGYYEITPRR